MERQTEYQRRAAKARRSLAAIEISPLSSEMYQEFTGVAVEPIKLPYGFKTLRLQGSEISLQARNDSDVGPRCKYGDQDDLLALVDSGFEILLEAESIESGYRGIPAKEVGQIVLHGVKDQESRSSGGRTFQDSEQSRVYDRLMNSLSKLSGHSPLRSPEDLMLDGLEMDRDVEMAVLDVRSALGAYQRVVPEDLQNPLYSFGDRSITVKDVENLIWELDG